MPTSAKEKEFVSYVVELMQPVGMVSAKRMFGGYSIFLDGMMFALVADSTLYLKADAETENVFEENGLERFKYNKRERNTQCPIIARPKRRWRTSMK